MIVWILFLQVKFDVDAAAKRVRITMSKLRFVDEGKYCVQILKADGHSNDDAFFNIYVKGEYGEAELSHVWLSKRWLVTV